MKLAVLLMSILFTPIQILFANTLSTKIQKAKTLEQSNPALSIKLYKQISKNISSKGQYYFKIATLYNQISDTNNTLSYITKSILYSPSYLNIYFSDSSFQPILKNHYDDILKYATKSKLKHCWTEHHPDVSTKLNELLKMDQEYRKQITYFSKYDTTNFKKRFDSLMILQKVLDKKNQLLLDDLITTYKFPDLSNSKYEDMKIAWTIVQHCTDIKKRVKYISIFRKSVKLHNAPYNLLAQLIDRTLIFKRKKQYYGTELKYENGVFIDQPSISLKKMNKKRIKFGMYEFSK